MTKVYPAYTMYFRDVVKILTNFPKLFILQKLYKFGISSADVRGARPHDDTPKELKRYSNSCNIIFEDLSIIKHFFFYNFWYVYVQDVHFKKMCQVNLVESKFGPKYIFGLGAWGQK